MVACGFIIHASPSRAARRTPPSLLAASHTGGRGLCSGRIEIRVDCSLKCFPS